MNNIINRVKCALLFLFASLSAMLAEKGGVAPLQSTLDDVEHCDWLIQSGDSNHRSGNQVMSIGIGKGSDQANKILVKLTL